MLFHPFRARLSWIRYAAAVSALTAGVAGAGCTALDADAGESDGSGTDGTGTDGGGLGDGGLALDGAGGQGSEGPDGQTYCQEADVDFVPKTPTVYVLVDRSSSMFEQTDYWGTLKTAVLPVIEKLQSDVLFGFGTYTGTENSCTGLSEGAPIAENSYSAIKSAYDAIGAPLDTDPKNETPTPLAIQQTADLLRDFEAPGDRFILLVTDGAPDFCDDQKALCATDALVAAMQLAAAQGVRTLVFGIDNEALVVNETQLTAKQLFDMYAQAGMGEEPNWAIGHDHGMHSGTIANQCATQVPLWDELREANGLDGEWYPAGNYSEAGGTATAFLDSDPSALATQIQATVEGLKSCTFDLGASNVEVKAGSEGQGNIFVNEEQIPADQWQMNSTTQLELLGEACDTWQLPEVTKFFAGFPCDALTIK